MTIAKPNTEPEILGVLAQQATSWHKEFPTHMPAIVVPIFNAYDDVVQCVESLAATTSTDVPKLLLDDASTDERIERTLTAFSQRADFYYICKPTNGGFVDTVNLGFEWLAPRDVITVNSDVVFPPNWLERLRTAAYYRSNIATASPLTNHGTILSVPYRNQPMCELVDGLTTEQVDARIQEKTLTLYPLIPTAVAYCTYFRRTALDVVGYFDTTFSPGYGEEVDFSQRALQQSFTHVAADNLFVFHKHGRSFNQTDQTTQQTLQKRHHPILEKRYPWYINMVHQVCNDLDSPLALALNRAHVAILGHRIAIDATYLDGTRVGTMVYVLELVYALTKQPECKKHLTLIISDTIAEETIADIWGTVEHVVRISDLKPIDQPIFDLIYRPFQVREIEELRFLRAIAHRFAILQLDLITYKNPSYAHNWEDWNRFRQLTQLILATADGVAFLTQDVAQDVAHNGLSVPKNRSRVLNAGTDHYRQNGVKNEPADREVPKRIQELGDAPLLMVLGTNFKHKNRVYAIRLFQELVRLYQWSGQLTFAGNPVAFGDSSAEEEAALHAVPELSHRIRDLGAVTESEKERLYQQAALVLYPSIVEGFGLIPFEAAVANTPVLTLQSTSLAEALGDEVLYLDSFNPTKGAEIAWRILKSSELAERQVKLIQERMALYRWSDVADCTWQFCLDILALPRRTQHLSQVETELTDAHEERINEGTIAAFRRKTQLSIHLLRTQGIGAVLTEVKQYLRWRLKLA
ncbi:glycosyltransferase [Chloroflexi bacterium TSY]|nr:glycosyltransferase [Chloroflexi bacterium TSY]